MKTYIVAGEARCGTTMMVAAHEHGGIPGLYDANVYSNGAVMHYPHNGLEWSGGDLTVDNLEGKVVKRFGASLLTDVPQDMNDLHVVYMTRDAAARQLRMHKNQSHARGITLRGIQAEVPLERLYYNYLRLQCRNISYITADPRVKEIVVLDYDHVIDCPQTNMRLLLRHGWEFNPQLAANAINPAMRHERRQT